ncbi:MULTISPECIES: HlyD family type I secretion periplasmic adaptor subunit [Sulfitobacter]|jgi:HlyD family type I secretion membrane fusion protein|uniref:Membrane fusion protein (MFP) family protein n=1 Tax=Sulfitobacter dubius TaxID=218673 RepID=A0ABY3ZFV0_9RHOB|nr:HlyD family type I secretion periplasmic adaptor subunit [Sulfitobacter dubius]UOA13532.1 Type I secretion system membrane fusion protein PrsE [Sulfitobacter dubius]WOI28394.1 HlyD family type I secretion periplasmic adaptor subunit [Sulfitobacter dubius]
MSDQTDKRWSATRPLILGFLGLIVLFGGFGTWAVTSQIAGAVVASGRIEVDRNRQIVQHETGGVVAEIRVDEGDSVAAGDVLLQLDAEQLTSQLAIVEGQLFELMARRGRLEAQRDETDAVTFDDELIAAGSENTDVQELIDGQRNLFDARRVSVAQELEQLGKRRLQINAQIRGVDAQETALARQLDLIEEELGNQQSLLDRGLTQASAVLNLQREEARLTGQIGELSAQKAQSQERVTEIDIERLKLRSAGREEAITQLRDLRYRELEMAEQRRALRAEIDRLSIRAPVSGIIYAMQVQTPRSVVRAAEPLMYLVPQDRPLIIASRVQTIHIDQVAVGQEVNLRLSALNQRTTPELIGKVLQVSADSIEDDATGQTYYRAEIALNPGETDKLEEGTILLPGMPVEAFIRTGERSPMAYLLKPMADYFARAFRES